MTFLTMQDPVGPIDLNLLVVFDAVMAERNFRRAAVRLGRSQPAISQAVARLRDLVGDDLFTKAPTGAEPTARAEALWRDIREPLRKMANALDHRSFDPKTVAAEIILGLSDDVHDIAFGSIVRALRSTAPNVVLRVLPTDHRSVWRQIRSGEMDLAVTVAPSPPRGLGAEVLLEQGFVLLHRADQAPPASLAAYLRASHVAVAFSGMDRGFTDEHLADKGRQRSVLAWTPRFASIFDLVKQTGALATMPAPICQYHLDANSRLRGSLTMSDLPFNLHTVPIRIGWHQRRSFDPLHEWVRGVVSEQIRATFNLASD